MTGMRYETAAFHMQITGVRGTEVEKGPSAPYMTSTMLTDAANQLGSNVARTMANAQALFEGGDAGAAHLCFAC